MKKLLFFMTLSLSSSLACQAKLTPQEAAKKNEDCHFLHIPKEVQAIIGSYLNIKDIANIELTSKDLKNSINYLAKCYWKQNIQENTKTKKNNLFLQAKCNIPTKTSLDIMKECKIKNPENITLEDVKTLIHYVAKNNNVTNMLFDIAGYYAPESKIHKKLINMTPYHLLLPVITTYIEKLKLPGKQGEAAIYVFRQLLPSFANKTEPKDIKLSLLFITLLCFKNNIFNVCYKLRKKLHSLNIRTWDHSDLLEKAIKEKFIPLIHYILNNASHENRLMDMLFKHLRKATMLLPVETFKRFIDKADLFKHLRVFPYENFLQEALQYGIWSMNLKKIKLLAQKARPTDVYWALEDIKKIEKTIKKIKEESKEKGEERFRFTHFSNPIIYHWVKKCDKREAIETILTTNKNYLENELKEWGLL